MTPVIRVDDQVWAALKSRAEPLEDSPNDVLRRVLGLDEVRPSASPDSPDLGERIQDFLEQMVLSDHEPGFVLDDSNRTFIGFFSRSWTSPHLLKGTMKSGRILWLLFESRSTGARKHLSLHVEIRPGDAGTRSSIFAAVQRRNPFNRRRKELSPEWSRLFRKPILTRNDFEKHGHDIEWLENRIKEKWAEFKASEFPLIDEVIRNIDFGD